MDFDLYAKGQLPAYPDERHSGLTKRELFAAMALQGMMIHDGSNAAVHKDLPGRAVQYADALISRLEQE